MLVLLVGNGKELLVFCITFDLDHFVALYFFEVIIDKWSLAGVGGVKSLLSRW